MKWDTSDVAVHRSTCGKYVVVRALPEVWHAYELGPTSGVQLGPPVDSSAVARQACEQHQARRAA